MSNIDSDITRTKNLPSDKVGHGSYIAIVCLGSMFVTMAVLGVHVFTSLGIAAALAAVLLLVSWGLKLRARRAVRAQQKEDMRQLRENG